ncbi:sigma-54-dependent transcriptional regulator [Fodinicurvata fenggangensis]|uniref:sigma-54-dependent transcriptional regulator n=1 Tax=Fodinicurvata fenggangensis TaxID=1121830 RepID=UPI0009DE35D8|nr:sigma-54 dependent transcriptional regulator [Fodinicurvata fenggangensis]
MSTARDTAPIQDTEGETAARPSILMIEDTAALAAVYQEYLKREGHDVITATNGQTALRFLAETPPSLVLLDIRLPDIDGLEILDHIRQATPGTPVVVMTADGSVNLAVQAMRRGAYDFLVKPFTADRLLVTVGNALERLRLQEMVETYRARIAQPRFHGFIGASLPMQAVYEVIENAASSRATVFITGESGTGKEICAEALHQQSPRRDGPFVAINCAAIPHELMESEIFGHVRGAFTGAIADRAGAAARADGGTLFLDEICELGLDLQGKLLRFLQTGRYERLGGTHSEQADIRIICATNRDPQQSVRDGLFREDLYYRLHVIPIHLPPLRERGDDILEIARHYLAQFAVEEGKQLLHYTNQAEQLLRSRSWHGNIRELQNVIRNVVVLNDGEAVTVPMLEQAFAPTAGKQRPVTPHTQNRSSGQAAQEDNAPPTIRPLHQVEQEAILQAIETFDGNIPRAAVHLKVSPSTLYRKLQSWRAKMN